MSLALYAHPFAAYCWKALIALYENATPFTYRLVEDAAGWGRTCVALANQEVASSPGRRRDGRRIQHHCRILDASLSRTDANDTGERRRSPNGAPHGSVLLQ